MFTLRIHTVDDSKPLFETPFTTVTATSRSKSATVSAASPNPKLYPTELRGVVHLFRNLPPSSPALSNPTARTTLVFIVAVPSYISPEDFLLFCGSDVDHFSELCVIRDDSVEDRYSVLIRLVNQMAADGFYCTFNGKRFKPSEAEVCHVYFTQLVEYSGSVEFAGKPPPGYTELPTCPICLERLDHDTSAIQITLCDHSFHCSCTSKWTSLSCQVCRLCQRHDGKPTCAACGTSKNPWVCLICGFVGCGRYEEGHAIRHRNDTQHCYSLELETQQIWDYVGDKYVHRLNQSKVDSKSTMTNFRCLSLEEECEACNDKEDSGVGGALFNSKVDAIFDEYNHLLATQMEIQRQHYESLLAEARSRKDISIADAVEKAEVTTMQEIQYKLQEISQQMKAVSEINEDLAKNQELLKKEYKDIQEREISSLKSRDEKILDLEEQIRDMKLYIETQRRLAESTDADDIKGGTILSVQSNQSSPSKNPKRRAKSSRKHN